AYFLYARKSTDEDDKQIMSIDSQLHELRDFARREGLVVVEEFAEAKTAKHPGRPVFNLMMEQVEAGKADGLLAWHPDRLARNSVDGGRIIYFLDIAALHDLRFPTYRFENNAQGKFVLSIAFGQSKYYVDSLSENVKRGYREKLRRGGWPGLAPLGYRNDEVNHTIVVDAEPALLVKKLFEVYATGEYTLEELQREAGRWGLRSKSGKPVRKNVIDKILRNPFYYGVMRFTTGSCGFEASSMTAATRRSYQKRCLIGPKKHSPYGASPASTASSSSPSPAFCAVVSAGAW
ncbi:MAG: recombinase family protein, partial [Candidatus Omnitrophica bacterium]|nr:recombinase family protein [Candidatus Omnitrophota bacterium]